MKESKEIELSRIDIVEETLVQYLVKELKRMAKEEFGKFSAIITVLFTSGLWIIKSLWYAYLSGKFSLYKIDRSYINTDSDNVFLDIIQLGAILVIWSCIDYIYYKVSITKDKSKFKWKRKLKKLLFWFIEMSIAFFLVLHNAQTNVVVFYKETGLSGILIVLSAIWFLCLMINIFAIEFAFENWIMEKKKTKNKRRRKKLAAIFFFFAVTVSVELFIAYSAGTWSENNRNGFKVIMSKVQEKGRTNQDIKYGKNKGRYKMFPIVYENQDCYIVTRLYKDEQEIKIDYNYQKIIEKDGVETIYINNIYAIETVD